MTEQLRSYRLSLAEAELRARQAELELERARLGRMERIPNLQSSRIRFFVEVEPRALGLADDMMRTLAELLVEQLIRVKRDRRADMRDERDPVRRALQNA